MKAVYTLNPAYPGNPFIEALPPTLGGQALVDALGHFPAYDEASRQLPAEVRLQMLGTLYEVYQPLEMTVQLYYQVYAAMQHSFAQKLTVADVQQYHTNYGDLQNRRITAATGGGNSFSVIGISGLGKSRTLQQVLGLFPPVIEHEAYNGQPLVCKQIPYIVVQTPSDASIKALCLDILLQIDGASGTAHHQRAITNRLSTDMMVSQIAQISKSINLGLLVVDEIQNIAHIRNGGGTRLLNFIVQLINSAHLSVCMVGTPQVLGTLQAEFRSARRATGLVYDRLGNNDEFSLLLKSLWRYQYTRNSADLTPEVANWIYRKTQGVPDIVVKLIYHSQQRAIMDGTENITIEVLEKAYRTSLQMVDGFLASLNDTPKRQRTAPKPGTGDLTVNTQSMEPHQTTGRANLRAIVADAKKQGKPVVDALAEYATEVAIL